MRTGVLGGVLLAALLNSAGPARAASFDGAWSVLVITDRGECDRGYRYGVRIANGRVSYAEEADINLAGTVSPNGVVKVSISRGNQAATGTGRLSAQAGNGTWSGRGSAGVCSGHWEAERR